jgi:histidinol-phosphatase (PHP family)
MRYSCLHTHSTFCDGEDTIETLCRRAYELHFASLGFSSHAPVYRKTGLESDWHIPEERLEEYLDTVRAARRRWEGKLPVYLGLEVDYIPGLMGPADGDYRDMGLDYTIGSVHYVPSPRGGFMAVDSSPGEFEETLGREFDGDGEALMEAYWDALEGMIRAGGFDILGHPDLVKKNNPREQWFSREGEAYRRRLRAAAAAVAEAGIVAEVNTGGMLRGAAAEPYPSPEMLGLLLEGGVGITINADAHRAEHLGGHYETARRILLRTGYTRVLLFKGRKGGVPLWEEEPLEDPVNGSAAPPRSYTRYT